MDLDLTGWNCSYCPRSRSHLQFNTFLHFINFFSHQTVLSSSPQHSQTASYAYSSTDAETLVHAFISSSLAVNNALFFLVFLILFWISSSTFKILLQGFLPFQKRSSYIILVLCSLLAACYISYSISNPPYHFQSSPQYIWCPSPLLPTSLA